MQHSLKLENECINDRYVAFHNIINPTYISDDVYKVHLRTLKRFNVPIYTNNTHNKIGFLRGSVC